MAERILIAMSGGVDSAAAAALLVEQGHEVIGATLDLGEGRCCLLHEARESCRQLGIRHELLDARARFADQVIGYFLAESAAGRTPSPCIHCNAWIKFGWLLDQARVLGCTRLATGHYARLAERDGHRVIRQAVDLQKDQSYFLFELSAEQRAHAMFPLGELTKPEARAICRRHGLMVADRPESQDLCFVPQGQHADFLRQRLPELERPGAIVTMDDRALGEHRGIYRYTIGQRQGLGLHGGPWFVVALRPATNEVVIGSREQASTDVAELQDLHWQIDPPAGPLRCAVRIRYHHTAAPAVVEPLTGNRARVRFDDPQFAITPGQAAAFYADELILGGGWIA